MITNYGEPFKPEPLYKIVAHLPRFIYDYFVEGLSRERRYRRFSDDERLKIVKAQEQKGIEAALNYNS